MTKIPFYKDPYFYRKQIYFLFLYLISLGITAYAPLIYNNDCVFLLLETECNAVGTTETLLKLLIPTTFLLGFIGLFLYNKLSALKKILQGAIFLHFLGIGLLGYAVFQIKMLLGIGGILFIVSIATLWVSFLNVKKDIKRLKSSERFV